MAAKQEEAVTRGGVSKTMNFFVHFLLKEVQEDADTHPM